MSRRHYNLPPLTTLSAFETAARHQSFKNAAQELSVTPGAVSHQIKALEGELGAALFQRRHRGVELTEAGLALFNILGSSFAGISRTLDGIRNRSNAQKVTVGSTTAVAALWLSPAIIRFWREFPDINVSQVAQDQPFVGRADLDFFVRYGKDPDPELSHTALYRDHLVPVASPELASELTGASLEVLAQQRLIHLDTNRNWTSWGDWFRALGYKGTITTETQVNSYSLALQMAGKGAGLALGWQRLIQPMLESGKLVPIGPHVLQAPNKFYLVGRPDDQLSDMALELKTWILKEVPESSL